jgi:hypothetical protein
LNLVFAIDQSLVCSETTTLSLMLTRLQDLIDWQYDFGVAQSVCEIGGHAYVQMIDGIPSAMGRGHR